MSGWPRKIPDRARYRKVHVEALEAQVRSLRRQITKRHWTPVDVEAETQDGYSTPWLRQKAPK